MTAKDYDIVCLQEVWTDTARQIFTEKLRTNYPWMVLKGFAGGPVTESGLFIASKFPIVNAVFNAFTDSKLPDSNVNKGIMGALIK